MRRAVASSVSLQSGMAADLDSESPTAPTPDPSGFDQLHIDPFALFDQWFALALKQEPNDPNAAALATASPDGRPSVRMVLAKPVAGHPFCFFTNDQSRKGRELVANPRASLCFHWKSLRRQVRVDGAISDLSPQESDAYFHSRSRASQISAAVSAQSRPLPNRESLEEQVRVFVESHPAEIPRPAHWRGFRLDPEAIEFWISGEHRLHDRLLFTRFTPTPSAPSWQTTRLYP